MLKLIQITTALVLFVQTIGYSQTEQTNLTTQPEETVLTKQPAKTEIDAQTAEKFVGTYYLSEGDFNLQIVMEDNDFFIVTEFSKDLLLQKNETTLHELTRGVDLALIKDHKNALKFSQNGYVTTINRVAAKTQK